jgi:hypothetical protein
MSMTKAEKAELKAITKERDMYRAMFISPPVEPDIQIPEAFTEMSRGWMYNVSLSGYSDSVRAIKAASTSVSHRFGDNAWESEWRNGSQNARRLYSTKALSLRAARHEASVRCAEILARVDREIAACEAEDVP